MIAVLEVQVYIVRRWGGEQIKGFKEKKECSTVAMAFLPR